MYTQQGSVEVLQVTWLFLYYVIVALFGRYCVSLSVLDLLPESLRRPRAVTLSRGDVSSPERPSAVISVAQYSAPLALVMYHAHYASGDRSHRYRYHYHAHRISYCCLRSRLSCIQCHQDLGQRPLWPIMNWRICKLPCPTYRCLTLCRWFRCKEHRGSCHSAPSFHRCRRKL